MFPGGETNSGFKVQNLKAEEQCAKSKARVNVLEDLEGAVLIQQFYITPRLALLTIH